MKKRKRKPRGYWAQKENQKEFLDSLLHKYNIKPEKLTSTMIRKNGGIRLQTYYANTLEMLEAHYGEISLLDLPRVPRGAWKRPKCRIEAVQEAVERLGKRPERVRKEDLCRIGLEGLIVNSGLGIRELMREAGYDVPDPVSWQSGKVRAAKVRELVEKAGGTDRVTFRYIKKRARGLVEYYSFAGGKSGGCRVARGGKEENIEYRTPINDFRFKKLREKKREKIRQDNRINRIRERREEKRKECRSGNVDLRSKGEVVREKWGMLPGEHIPVLYWILKDAGYDVTPDDCLRGLDALEEVASGHGHLNHSLAEALVDDWIYDFAGMDHMHDVNYPGQKGPERNKVDCDFVLFPNTSDKCPVTSDIQSTANLWVEYAGLWSERKNRLVRKYKRRMRAKKALAKKAGIALVVITPANMKKPENVWDEMVSKAPWLKKRRKAAMGSRFLERLAGKQR